MPTAQPFRIDIPQEKLDAIMARGGTVSSPGQ